MQLFQHVAISKKILLKCFLCLILIAFRLNNQVHDGKLENSFLFRNFYNGGGVAIGDINNDGFADVMLTSNTGTNKLFLNTTDTSKSKVLQFKDISTTAGIIN